MGKSDTNVGVNNREMRRIFTQSASMISSGRKTPSGKQECFTDSYCCECH